MSLGGQAMTALGATALQDKAAGAGGHAGTKTMGPLAVDDAGLKGTLHGITSYGMLV
jgi:hypothetical protein